METNENGEPSMSSPILSSRYAHKAAQLVYSIEKKFVFVIAVIVALFVFALVDIFQVKGYFFLLRDDINDIIIIALAVISIATLTIVLIRVSKSRKVLSNWGNLFERSSIKAGISIVMDKKRNEDAVLAVAQTIEELREPLNEYISSKDNFNEFLDVSINTDGNNNDNKSSKKSEYYDVLMDADHVLQTTNQQKDLKISDALKKVLKEYGSIIIKIIDGSVEDQHIRSFFDSISNYTSISKNHVGLALIIGDSASQDAYRLLGHYSTTEKNIQHSIIIEKPTIEI
jgi:hypothetical protein